MADVSGISVDVGSIQSTLLGLHEAESRLKEALRILADTAAKKMERWAKENAKWEDRTTNARQGLRGEGYWEDENNLVVAIMHQVDYGIWLELAMAKKYAILEQALESGKDELIAQYKRLIGG